MNVECSNFKFSIETLLHFGIDIFSFAYPFLLPQHKLQRPDNFSDVFTLRVVDQQVKNNSLSQKGILHFAPNHIIKPF